MKERHILILLALIITFCVFLNIHQTSKKEIILGDSYIIGDVNGDGYVKTNDYLLIRKHILKMPALTGEPLKRADINNDGKINTEDYIQIRKIILNPPKPTNFVMLKNGSLLTDIVVSNNATSKENNAAKDLQKYLKMIAGTEPKIVLENNMNNDSLHIMIGKTNASVSKGITKPTGYPGEERVLIKQMNNYLFVMGNDDGNYNGTQFAVNMLLEHLGCGWYGEGELWEVVPKLTNIDLTNYDLEHSPKFNSRITRVYDGKYSVANKWYLGGNISVTGHWLSIIVPPSMYKDHPNWFAVNEKGIRDPSGLDYYQLDYSNEELAKYVANKLIEYFDKNPLVVSMTIGYNDGWNEHFCQCSKCSSLGNQSDVLVYFANNVARLVKSKYPDKKLIIMSYHMTYEPPKNSVKLESNVELMLTRESSMTKALDTDYFKSGYDNITKNTYTKSWRQNALEWIKKTSPSHISIWEWYCLSAGDVNWKDVPWVQGNVATRNQTLWKNLGAEYVFYDQGPIDAYYEDKTSFNLRWPLWYVASRSMWGTNKTGEELLHEACKKLFGNAAESMYKYYKKLADISENTNLYSMTWVPANVKDFYKSNVTEINNIVKTIKTDRNKCNNLEKQRIDNQLAYWDSTLKKVM